MRRRGTAWSRGVRAVGAGLVAATATGSALADPPPDLFEATEEAFAACAAEGGTAQILAGYEANMDLNGDGLADYITDQSRLACDAAEEAQAICAPDGCSIIVWLSQPDGTYRRVDLGASVTYEVLAPRGEFGLPRLRSIHPGAFCAASGLEAPVCTRTWSFAGEAPEASALVPPPPLRPESRPPAGDLPLRPVAPGWTLRQAGGGSTVALGGGAGDLISLGAFCLQDHPFLVLRFAEGRETERVGLSFAFSAGSVEAEALREETAGGDYVIDLAPTRLAARLAGPDRVAMISIDGDAPLELSLNGSTASIRAALGGCYDF